MAPLPPAGLLSMAVAVLEHMKGKGGKGGCQGGVRRVELGAGGNRNGERSFCNGVVS